MSVLPLRSLREKRERVERDDRDMKPRFAPGGIIRPIGGGPSGMFRVRVIVDYGNIVEIESLREPEPFQKKLLGYYDKRIVKLEAAP